MPPLQPEEQVKHEIYEYFNSFATTQITDLNSLINSRIPINAEKTTRIFSLASLLEWFIPSATNFLPYASILSPVHKFHAPSPEPNSQHTENLPLRQLCQFNPTLRLLYQIRHHVLFCHASQDSNDRSPCLGIYLAIINCADPRQPRLPYQLNVSYIYSRAAYNLSDYFRRHPDRSLHTAFNSQICQVSHKCRDMLITELYKCFSESQFTPSLAFDNYHFTPKDVRTHVRVTYDENNDLPPTTQNDGPTPSFRSPEVTSRNKRFRIHFDHQSKLSQNFNASIFPDEITLTADPRQCIINILDKEPISAFLTRLTLNNLPQTTPIVQLIHRILNEYFAYKRRQIQNPDDPPYVSLRIVQLLTADITHLYSKISHYQTLSTRDIELRNTIFTLYSLFSSYLSLGPSQAPSELRRLFQVYSPPHVTSFHIFRFITFLSYIYEYIQVTYPVNSLFPPRDLSESLTDFCKVYDRINVPSLRLHDYFSNIDLDHAALMHPGLYLVAQTAQQSTIVEWTKLNPKLLGFKTGLHRITSLRSSSDSEYDFYLTKFDVSVFEDILLKQLNFNSWPRADDGNDEYDYIDDPYPFEI